MKKCDTKLYLQKKKRALKKIFGTAEKPRLAVFRSHKHIYAQLIDDNARKTLAFSSTLNADTKNKVSISRTKEAAFFVGENVAKMALTKNIKKIVFDRGERPYHGRIQKLAEGARSAGLVF